MQVNSRRRPPPPAAARATPTSIKPGPSVNEMCRHSCPSSPKIVQKNTQRPLPAVPLHRWRQFFTDCHRFLSAGCWAERAAAKGWDALGLFGCGLHRPLVHRGAAGLLWAIAGGRLVELHRDWAVVELAENGSRRDRRRLETGNVRLPWIGA